MVLIEIVNSGRAVVFAHFRCWVLDNAGEEGGRRVGRAGTVREKGPPVRERCLTIQFLCNK